jgi:hypothetical protein
MEEIHWTSDETNDLIRLYPSKSNDEIACILSISKLRVERKARSLGLRKSDEYMDSLDQIRMRRFAGRVSHNAKPIGSYRVSEDGILQRKLFHRRGNRGWASVHALIWVEANGPVPPKHMLVFKQGMRTNILDEITLDKLECISVVENMLRNSCNNFPPELRQITRLRGILTEQINKRKKHGKDD